MDTPLVKILLIAAAIAITVGVIVLAWSIFNEGSAEVSTDQDDRAIAAEAGTRADGVRARIDNERACEALGSSHWIEYGTDTDGAEDGTLNNNVFNKKDGKADVDNNDKIQEDPATKVKESESHCAAGADTRDTTSGLTRKVILNTGDTKANAEWRTYVYE